MKLQDQCCTWEQGQRLVELGVKADATFWWMPAKSGTHGEYIQYGYHGDNISPAFNVAELGMLLLSKISWSTQLCKFDSGGSYCHVELVGEGFSVHTTEAIGRADLLIHLLEKNLIP